MACFKDWLVSESFKNTYESLVMDILIERTCFDAFKIILESEEDPEEPFIGDLEAEKFPEPDERVKPVSVQPDSSSPPSEEEISAKEASTIRQMQKELKDAILVLRWNAMAKRAKQIEEIKSLRDQYVKQYGVPAGTKLENPDSIQENTEEDEDDIDFLKSMAKHGSIPSSVGGNASKNIQSSFDVMQAAPLLEKLGYVNVDKLRGEGLEDDQIKKAVTHALFKAAQEGGNEVPAGVEDFLNPTALKKATDEFFLLTRDIFKRTFKKIVRSQISYVVGGKQGPQKASKLFDPGYFDPKEIGYKSDQSIDDIAEGFALKMLENFTTREVSSSTAKPQSWLKVKKRALGQKADELDSEEFVGDLITYISTHLKNYKSNLDREAKLANSPSGPSRDLDVWGGNRDKKAAMINADIEENNLEFYKNYMDATDSKREELDNGLKELKSKLKKTKKLSKDEHEEKWRLEILQQIFFLHSRHSESLPLDSKQIENTLDYFRSNFLGHKYRSESFFGAMGRKTDSSGEEKGFDIGAGTDSTARAGDSGSSRDIGAGREANPAAAHEFARMKGIMHKKLLDALDALRMSDMGKLQALTICVFWDLGTCSPHSRITNLDKFSELLVTLKGEKSKKDGEKTVEKPCVDSLMQISSGKEIKQAAEEVRAILGSADYPTDGTFRNWLDAGLEFICSHMQGSKMPSSIVPSLRPSALPPRRFDASRPSPLASKLQPTGASTGKITSGGGVKLATDPETGKKRWTTEN